MGIAVVDVPVLRMNLVSGMRFQQVKEFVHIARFADSRPYRFAILRYLRHPELM